MDACGPSTGEANTRDCEFKTSLGNRDPVSKRQRQNKTTTKGILFSYFLQETNRPILLKTIHQTEKFKDWHIIAQPLTSN